jgi:membrane-associated phospholipid phosphatase
MQSRRSRYRWAPARAALIGAVLVLVQSVPAAAGAETINAANAAPKQSSSWWHESYAVDYGLIATGGVLYLLPSLIDTPSVARLGPIYDPDAPAQVLSPAFANDIGEPYAEEGEGETVPTLWMGYALGAGLGWLAAQELMPWLRGDEANAQRLHDTAVGYVEGLALTLGVVEVLKMGVGRLRPDFQDRALRYHCHTEVVAGLDCAGTTPLDPDPEQARWLLNDGRKSFPSGHSATAMYLSSYLTYAIGGRYVWGPDATTTSRSAGVLAQALLLSAGVFTAGSRYGDGRHHVGDALTGGALGLGFASLAYWRRFDTTGRLRGRTTAQDASDEISHITVSWQLTMVQGRF